MNRRRRSLFIASFLAPAALLYLVFVIVPLVQAFSFSLYRWKGLSPNRKFVGLDNFPWAFQDSGFQVSLFNTAILLVVCGVITFAASLTVAQWMRSKSGVARALRGTFLFPHVISIVAVAILWKFLYHPTIGLINATLKGIGLGQFTATWLGDAPTALGSIGVSFVWWAIGFYVMLFIAGLGAIPEEVDEAANLDGATGWAKFWHVTWPMLWSVKKVAATYLVINILNIFALIMLMTRGGDPDRATENTLSYLYEVGFESSRFGHASAIAVINFAIALALGGLMAFLFRKNPEASRT